MAGKFAFIVNEFHPERIKGFYNLLPLLPQCFSDRLIRFIPPSAVAGVQEIHTRRGPAGGEIISLNFPGSRLEKLPPEVLVNIVIQAGKFAENRGARIIGLDPLLAVHSRAGVDVACKLRAAVTNGASFFISSMLEASLQLLSIMGKQLEQVEVVVFGATGPAGKVSARIMAGKGVNYLSLLSHDRHRLEQLVRLILLDEGVCCKVSAQAEKAASRADLIIIAPGGTEYIPALKCVKKEVVLCNISRSLILKRCSVSPGDVFDITGAIINPPPNINFTPRFSFSGESFYASLVETMILAMEGRFENYSLGYELRQCKIDEMTRLSLKHDFRCTGVLNHKQPLYFDSILNRKCIQDNVAPATG